MLLLNDTCSFFQSFIPIEKLKRIIAHSLLFIVIVHNCACNDNGATLGPLGMTRKQWFDLNVICELLSGFHHRRI